MNFQNLISVKKKIWFIKTTNYKIKPSKNRTAPIIKVEDLALLFSINRFTNGTASPVSSAVFILL